MRQGHPGCRSRRSSREKIDAAHAPTYRCGMHKTLHTTQPSNEFARSGVTQKPNIRMYHSKDYVICERSHFSCGSSSSLRTRAGEKAGTHRKTTPPPLALASSSWMPLRATCHTLRSACRRSCSRLERRSCSSDACSLAPASAAVAVDSSLDASVSLRLARVVERSSRTSSRTRSSLGWFEEGGGGAQQEKRNSNTDYGCGWVRIRTYIRAHGRGRRGETTGWLGCCTL